MKKFFGISGILMLCLLAASLAFAQQETTTGGQADQSSLNKNASDILDKKIVNPEGKELGKIEDFVIDESGKIQYVILSSGGFIGIGGEKYTIQWDKIQLQAGDDDQLIANVQEADLEKFQAKSDRPAEQPGQMAQRDQTALGTQPMSQAPSSTAQTESRQPVEQGQGAVEKQMSVEETKDWIGKTVSGKDGEQLGTVNNLFIGSEGSVQYVVISSEDNKLHPVPIELVSKKQEGEGLQAEFSKDIFEKSVSFAQSEAPNLGEPDWENRIRGFYSDEGMMKKEGEKSGMQEKQSEPGKTEKKQQ